MKKIFRYLKMIFYNRFIIIDNCYSSNKKGLNFSHNIYGDSINRFNCRSFWHDEYNFLYRCNELKT
jgi:hypothetical protein